MKINSVLNPSIPEDYDPNMTKADIFNCLGITEEEYYKCSINFTKFRL